ncbi:MAG: VanZ family protein [Parvibaculaceae bacterium]|nr:VanZ family protein [Parvibaculaceae bacterium]
MFRSAQLSLLIIASLLVLVLSAMPLGDIEIRGGDKVVHMAFYAALTLNGLWIWTQSKWHVAAIAFSYGVSLELLQEVLPYRWYSLDDIIANGVGVILGLLLAPFMLPLGSRVLNWCLKVSGYSSHRITPLLFLAPLLLTGLSGCTPTYVPRNDEPARVGLSYQAEYRDRPHVVSVDAADLLDRPSWQINEDACITDPEISVLIRASNPLIKSNRSVLSKGDMLEIQIADDAIFSGPVEIDQDGFLRLPYLPPIAVQGEAPSFVARMVAEQLVLEGHYTRLSVLNVSVRVIEFSGAQVMVAGAVFQPGSVMLNVRTAESIDKKRQSTAGDYVVARNMSTALRASGGVRPDADLNNVVLRRGGNARLIDMHAAVDGRLFEDVMLLAGDEIYVPTKTCFQSALMRPTPVTAPGIKVFMSNLTVPATSNAQSAVGVSAREVRYGTRLLQGLVGMNCVGGTHLTNADRFAVLMTRNPVTGKAVVIERQIEELVRYADRDEFDPYLLPGDALACYDSNFINFRDVLSTFGSVIGFGLL